jgi:Na+-transporting NADH:ubiquinone oxidoreductase subunit NqrC
MPEENANPFLKNWQLIVFIAGGILNAGIIIGGANYMEARISKLEAKEEQRQKQAVAVARIEEKVQNVEKTIGENKETLNDIEKLLFRLVSD